ncbi:MAG: zinc ribbon domain-containing protein [Rubripirellula sp.]
MPLYEYECKSCDDVVELLIRSPTEKAECPACGNDKIERVFSVPASPAIKGGGSLPVAGSGESCGAPRCCGGGCDM